MIKTIEIEGVKGINRIEWDLVKEEAKYTKSAYKSGTALYKAGRYLVILKSNNNLVEASFNLVEY
jgi:hypothetical protein